MTIDTNMVTAYKIKRRFTFKFPFTETYLEMIETPFLHEEIVRTLKRAGYRTQFIRFEGKQLIIQARQTTKWGFNE